MIKQNQSDEDQVVTAFQQDSHYKAHESDNTKKYIVQLQIARFGNLKAVSLLDVILFAGKDKDGCSIFYVIGQRQPVDKLQFQQFIQKFILMVDEKMENGFILVYFNSGLMSHTSISKFLEIYKILPLKYYSKLKKFYIVHGNVMLKSWLWFQGSVQFQVLKQKVALISKLSEFINGFMTKFSYILIPGFVKESDSSNQQLQYHVTSHDQLQIQPQQEEQKDHTNNQLTKVLGLHLHEYELNKFGIPVIIDVMASLFVNHEDYFKKEGIFRKNAGISQENEIVDSLTKRKYNLIVDRNEPYAMAGVLKKIIDKMPVPLIPFKMYRILVDNVKKQGDLNSQIGYIIETLNQLTQINQRMFSFIIGFLYRVSEFKDQNKMTAYNLAVVFGPCFLRPEVYSMEDLVDAGQVVRIIQIIIENNEAVFLIKKFNQIYPNQQFEQFLVQTDTNRSASVLVQQSGKLQGSHRATIDISYKI